MNQYKMLREEEAKFVSKKLKPGELIFSKHQFTDKHIQEVIEKIAAALGKPATEIVKHIEAEVDKFKETAEKAPILYQTIIQNIVEDQTFTFMQEAKLLVKEAPKYNGVVFQQLIREIKANHSSGLFPLHSWLNPKRLWDPVILTIPEPSRPELNSIKTAAATPDGQFYFNVDFMQNLITFAHIKGVKPKGKKYESNGGDIPDEYCYIEFLILHEFLHYVADDFYYQKVKPNANPTIINWVGDFRSNYELVKAGYEQLPMGLFNDGINLDRQTSYDAMYSIVESEFKKLPKDEQDKAKKQLDEMSDDHEPGQEKGSKSQPGQPGQKGEPGDGEPGDGEPGDGEAGPMGIPEGSGVATLDEHNEKIRERLGKGKDMTSEEADAETRRLEQERAREKTQSNKGGRGQGNDAMGGEIDYHKYKSRDWTSIIKEFINSGAAETEESYRKHHNSAISSAVTAAQTGAAAVKPGEVTVEMKEVKLAFVVDESGSMGSVIGKVFGNIAGLLKSKPELSKLMFTLLKFSHNYQIHKAFFKSDKCGSVLDVLEKPKTFNDSTDRVFKHHYQSVTNFSPALVADIKKLLNNSYNVILFSDSDLTSGENYDELIGLLKSQGKGKVFVLFDTRRTYNDFRRKSGNASLNISYIEDDKNSPTD
jgi:hypothetical protein